MRLKIKALTALILLFPLLLCSCYDSGDVEETAYLISLGIDKNSGGFSYTFQLAAPLKGSGGSGGGEEEKSTSEKASEKNDSEKGNSEKNTQKKDEKIFDSKNPTVNNIVIAASDFYTAKNMLSNYMSKSLNMSHLKMIVCAKEVAENSFKEHSELFSREREIRPGTFLCVSDGRAEAFLKAVNPELEGNTAKYYELVNSDKTLIFAPVKRLGDFSNDSETLDKSAVLPLTRLSEAESSSSLTFPEAKGGEMIKSNISRISSAKPEFWGMAILKDGKLVGTMDGTMALMYNILTGHTKNFVFSVKSPYDETDSLSFKCSIEQKPDISVFTDNNSIPQIFVKVNIFTEYMGSHLPKGYKNYSELNNSARQALKQELMSFFKETAQTYNSDILKIERLCKKNFLDQKSFEKSNFNKKYEKSVFNVEVYLSDNGVALF